METTIYLAVLGLAYLMVVAKRIPALVGGFRYQSFFLFLATLLVAFNERQAELYMVAGLILAVKVILIPHFLMLTVRKIKVNENLGFFINPQLSLAVSLVLTYCSWLVCRNLGFDRDVSQLMASTVAFAVVFIGAFLMVSRMKALTQVAGILVMENGIFLLASAVAGGMPFFAEIAIFFDVFVSVIIMALFVYRINKLFTHIDVNKLSRLRG